MTDDTKIRIKVLGDIIVDVLKMKTMYRDKKKSPGTDEAYADGVLMMCKRIDNITDQIPRSRE